jgi:hypothetical protein
MKMHDVQTSGSNVRRIQSKGNMIADLFGDDGVSAEAHDERDSLSASLLGAGGARMGAKDLDYL